MAARNSSSGQDARHRGAEEHFAIPTAFGSGAPSSSRSEHPSEQSEPAPTYPSVAAGFVQGSSTGVYLPHQMEVEPSKKARTQFSPKQLFYLEERFTENKFPTAKERENIAKELDLTLHHIQIWFQNRRAKDRRKKRKKKMEEQLCQAPQPPSFWPANLPFDSNITSRLSQTSLTEKAGVTKSERLSSSSSPAATTAPLSSPTSPPFHQSSPTSPLSGTSSSGPLESYTSQAHEAPLLQSRQTAVGPFSQEKHSVLEEPARVPPICAESPVILFDILEEIPELISPLHTQAHSHPPPPPPPPPPSSLSHIPAYQQQLQYSPLFQSGPSSAITGSHPPPYAPSFRIPYPAFSQSSIHGPIPQVRSPYTAPQSRLPPASSLFQPVLHFHHHQPPLSPMLPFQPLQYPLSHISPPLPSGDGAQSIITTTNS